MFIITALQKIFLFYKFIFFGILEKDFYVSLISLIHINHGKATPVKLFLNKFNRKMYMEVSQNITKKSIKNTSYKKIFFNYTLFKEIEASSILSYYEKTNKAVKEIKKIILFIILAINIVNIFNWSGFLNYIMLNLVLFSILSSFIPIISKIGSKIKYNGLISYIHYITEISYFDSLLELNNDKNQNNIETVLHINMPFLRAEEDTTFIKN